MGVRVCWRNGAQGDSLADTGDSTGAMRQYRVRAVPATCAYAAYTRALRVTAVVHSGARWGDAGRRRRRAAVGARGGRAVSRPPAAPRCGAVGRLCVCVCVCVYARVCVCVCVYVCVLLGGWVCGLFWVMVVVVAVVVKVVANSPNYA